MMLCAPGLNVDRWLVIIRTRRECAVSRIHDFAMGEIAVVWSVVERVQVGASGVKKSRNEVRGIA